MSNRWDIFRDDNKINEKSVVGFISFAIMILYIIIYAISGIFDWGVELHELIFNSLVTVVLGSFGIAEASKVVQAYGKARTTKEIPERERPLDDQNEVDDYLNSEE